MLLNHCWRDATNLHADLEFAAQKATENLAQAITILLCSISSEDAVSVVRMSRSEQDDAS